MMQKYRSMLSRLHPVRFVVSIDEDDRSMKSGEMQSYLRRQRDVQVFTGQSKTKIQAINADFDKLGDYDVLILASDDMVPQVRQYDLLIERLMLAKFPALDGCLHFSDGLNAQGLNTMPIGGKRLFDSWGYIYQPDYISTHCDDEFDAVTTRDGKVFRSPQVLFRHEWIESTGKDSTYRKNEGFWNRDKATFERRRAADFPR